MAEDTLLLENAARRAGEIACRFWSRSPKAWDKPGGLGPVTEADLAVDEMLRETLLAERPDYGWLSEETEDSDARLNRERVFIIDPIDGTRAFIEGSPAWAHSLAIARHGEVTAAVVYLPVPGKMYSAGKGAGAFLNGKPIVASSKEALEDAAILASRPSFDAWNWKDGLVPPAKRRFRPSLAYRMSLVAEGRFDAMLSLQASWEWDVAAGSLIVTEAGGCATDRRLTPLRFNSPHAQVNGVLAAGRTIHGKLGMRLSQA